MEWTPFNHWNINNSSLYRVISLFLSFQHFFSISYILGGVNMHSNEDDSPLYLFIQLKPYPHTFGRKMHVVETSIHMSFLTAFGWLCFKRRWLGVSIIVSITGNGIFWNQKCTACLRPMFKTILLNTSFIILFNLVFAQTVSISGHF